MVTEIDLPQLIEGFRRAHATDVSRLFSGVEKLILLRDSETGLSFFRPTVVGDGRFYADLARDPEYYPVDKEEYRIARTHIPAGATVCEVGAGIGMFRDHIPHAHYLGIELNEAAVQQAATRGLPLLRRHVEEFADEHPGAYNVTCAFQVVEHVADPLAFVAAMVKLTTPGGMMILSTPNGEAYVARTLDVRNAPPHHVTWWEDRTWIWLSQRFGLRELRIHHTLPDETLRDWAQMVARNGVAKLLGLELRPVVDESALRHRIDALAEQAASIILHGAQHRLDVPPVGHTTVAVFTR